ncbi:TetR/AcrR family transcriptional regulator [Deinococcus alpinitundrae]|uniref:TetR/AcrR family transcriptional regulator n=1 Tax=Deinococcus alpinitundrae TaxID=468913 RepID=UPI00137ACB93|nr:TetR/AcrR family transcriptional regulator [Deinococcus alpinitundrae]
MTMPVSSPPRERIVQAALALLESGGVDAVSTRAVSAAAGVQVPTLYRQFGDMQGLLGAVASAGFATYLQTKTARAGVGDPLTELRAGWDGHVQFGLDHPHLYALMYAAPQPGAAVPAALEAAELLRRLLQSVAETGGLAVSVESAAVMIHAAAMGVTLSLLSAPVADPHFSERMREAVLSAILTPEQWSASDAAERQAAAHAVSLAALLPGLPTPFTAAEQRLLLEWLRRLTG